MIIGDRIARKFCFENFKARKFDEKIVIVQYCKIMIRKEFTNEWWTNGRRWNGTLSEKKRKRKEKKKKKLSAHSPYAVGTTHGVISWYCGRDKRKRIVYTHERWTIISTIVKLADDAPLRRKTRDRGLHASRFLHFLWYFTLTIVSPWTNRSWVLEYLIKGTDSPFPSEFEFSFFQTRGRKELNI